MGRPIGSGGQRRVRRHLELLFRPRLGPARTEAFRRAPPSCPCSRFAAVRHFESASECAAAAVGELMEAVGAGKFVLDSDRLTAVENGARGAEQQGCAVAVVTQLLHRAGLSRMLDPQTFSVIVGEGNWISFSFIMRWGADHSRV